MGFGIEDDRARCPDTTDPGCSPKNLVLYPGLAVGSEDLRARTGASWIARVLMREKNAGSVTKDSIPP